MNFSLELLGLIGSLLAGEFVVVIWLYNQFNKVRSEMAMHKNEILAKLEYHERHDDQRFGQMHEALWNVKFSIRDMKEKEE